LSSLSSRRGTEGEVRRVTLDLKFCKLVPCKVNLIEYNPIDDGEFQQASQQAIDMYMHLLESNGITTRVRKFRGKDIDEACRQLGHSPHPRPFSLKRRVTPDLNVKSI
jgi:adenine C2-methylase RlmN of 23S rRNA A2503 and tRNA A37